MQARALLGPILSDENLTRGLGDAEARVLIEWLVDRAEELALSQAADEAELAIGVLCRRARGIAHFVRLWCLERAYGAASQLAVTERFTWPWPDARADACEVMQAVTVWETAAMDEQQTWSAG
jgi:hypothetical protein